MAAKEIYKDDFKLGGDGGEGNVALSADAGLLKFSFTAGFPIIKILKPLAQKIKGLIPGEKYDKYVDDGLEAILKSLGVEVSAEEAAPQAEIAPPTTAI